jgi:hypothetical protein
MMVTAYADNERWRLAGEYGPIEFITKPVDFGALKGQLRQLPSATDRPNAGMEAIKPTRRAEPWRLSDRRCRNPR